MQRIVLRGLKRELALGLGGWAAGVSQQLEEVGWGGRGSGGGIKGGAGRGRGSAGNRGEGETKGEGV
jgi:hypothetical protein